MAKKNRRMREHARLVRWLEAEARFDEEWRSRVRVSAGERPAKVVDARERVIEDGIAACAHAQYANGARRRRDRAHGFVAHVGTPKAEAVPVYPGRRPDRVETYPMGPYIRRAADA